MVRSASLSDYVPSTVTSTFNSALSWGQSLGVSTMRSANDGFHWITS